MRVTAVPEVRASAICSMFLYGGASRSFHDAGALRSFSFRNLSLVMKTSGSSAIATHCPSAWRKRAGQLCERRRLVRLEHAFADAGRERLDRTAEQHVDARVVLFRDDAGERLARREADEVDLDAGGLLELLEHRPRPVLGPDRVDVERLRRHGKRAAEKRYGGEAQRTARKGTGEPAEIHVHCVPPCECRTVADGERRGSRADGTPPGAAASNARAVGDRPRRLARDVVPDRWIARNQMTRREPGHSAPFFYHPVSGPAFARRAVNPGRAQSAGHAACGARRLPIGRAACATSRRRGVPCAKRSARAPRANARNTVRRCRLRRVHALHR